MILLISSCSWAPFHAGGYNQNWVYGPSGVLGLVLVIVLLGHIPRGF